MFRELMEAVRSDGAPGGGAPGGNAPGSQNGAGGGAPAGGGGAPNAGGTQNAGAGGDPGAGGARTAWGDNWRKEISGEDSGFLKQMERFATPQDFAKSYREAQARIAQGFKPEALPKDANAEQLKAWRERNGIPAEPGDYLKNLPQGLVIGEADKSRVDDFVAALHQANAPPEFVHAALGWYNKFQESEAAALVQGDGTHKAEAEHSLRQTWGADYQSNLNVIHNLLDGWSEDMQTALLSARVNGRALMNNPDFLVNLAALARQANPQSTVIPGGSGYEGKTIDGEIATIENVMRTKRAEYNKDEKMQARLRELYAARERMQNQQKRTA